MNADEPPREVNPYAPPATDCSPAEQNVDELRKLLKKVHEDCGALAVAWGILTIAAVLIAGWSFASFWPAVAWWRIAIAVPWAIAVLLTWRIRSAGVILGLVLNYLVILGPAILHPGLSIMLGLFLCPLIFQGHRILHNVGRLRRAGVEV